MSDTVVTLEFWISPAYRHRWSLVYQGKRLETYGTEAEARAAARLHGWTVVEDDGLIEGMG